MRSITSSEHLRQQIEILNVCTLSLISWISMPLCRLTSGITGSRVGHLDPVLVPVMGSRTADTKCYSIQFIYRRLYLVLQEPVST